MKIYSRYNYSNSNNVYESSNKPSLTIPDDIPSLSEILDRHSRGLDLDIPIFENYDDDDDFIDTQNPLLDGAGDLTDRHVLEDYVKNVKEQYDSISIQNDNASDSEVVNVDTQKVIP